MQLSIAKKFAYDLMQKEGLLQKGWRCEFDDAKNRLGCCKYREKTITLSRYYIALNSDEETLDTIRHEVAHALTPGADHGKVWQLEAKRLGASPVACASDVVAPKGYFVGTCPSCQKTIHKHREPQTFRKACGSCCQKYNSGKFDNRFIFVWKNEKTGEIFRDGRWREDENNKLKVCQGIAETFVEKFGATSVIEVKEVGKLPDFQFDDYDFKATPSGVFRAFLEVKMWRNIKDFVVLRTFWRLTDTKGFTLDVWENTYTQKYETADKRVDVKKMKVANWYELIVMPTEKGFLRLQTVKVSN